MRHAAVMVVEDDPALRETLDLAGYSSLPAADGQAALALLERERPALVVSDVQMQPMDGTALLHALRRRRPDLPVVLMTAFGTIRSAVQAVRDGAVEYLAKPFEPAALVGLIGQLLPAAAGDADAPLAELEQELLEALLQLSGALARRHELTVAPARIAELVREGVAALPATARQVTVHLNPLDLDLVRGSGPRGRGEARFELVADAGISRGGCRISTESSQVDLTLEARLDEALAQLRLGDEP